MAHLKSLLLATCAIALLAVAVNSKAFDDNSIYRNQSNDLIVGHHEYNEVLARQENVSVGASYIGRILEEKRTFNVTKGYTITQVLAMDLATDGTGASVAIIGGGPEKDFVTLEFESKRFHGIYFTVTVYAKKRY